MKQVSGDLLKLAEEGQFDVIVHGCNCFVTMGAGIARQIARKFPEAYAADCETLSGDISKLGTFSFHSYPNLTVVNAYTQYHYKITEGTVNVNYDAIREVFNAIKRVFTGKRIGIPKIGAGLAGGCWKVIEKIIEEEMKGEDITVVEYNDVILT